MDINKYLNALELDRFEDLHDLIISQNFDQNGSDAFNSFYNNIEDDIEQEDFYGLEDPMLFISRNNFDNIQDQF